MSTQREISKALQASFATCLGDFLATDGAKQVITNVMLAKIGVFLRRVSNATGTPIKDLENWWINSDIDLPFPVTVDATKPADPVKPKPPANTKAVVEAVEAETPPAAAPVKSKAKPKSKAQPKPQPNKCKMILTGSSKRKGEECGKNCKDGEEYCGTHSNSKKKLDIPPRKKDTAPTPPKPADDEQEHTEVVVQLKHNKWGNLQDPETLYVFVDGQVDPPMVFGKQNPKDGKYIELTDADFEYITGQGWGFKVDNDDVGHDECKTDDGTEVDE